MDGEEAGVGPPTTQLSLQTCFSCSLFCVTSRPAVGPQILIPFFLHPFYHQLLCSALPSKHISSLSPSCGLYHYPLAKPPRLPLASIIARAPPALPLLLALQSIPPTAAGVIF